MSTLNETGLKYVLQTLKSKIWKEVYPVGSIYMSVNSTNPSTLFGGTWEQIQDTFLLASGSTYSAGTTGGSADAVVVSHNHEPASDGYNFEIHKNNGGCERTRAKIDSSGRFTWMGKSGVSSAANSNLSSNGTTSTTGVSGTGKNMPPYLVVYVWKRTA